MWLNRTFAQYPVTVPIVMCLVASHIWVVCAQAQQPVPVFRDATAELGLEGLGNGQACWVDLSNNGWPDLITGGVVWRNDAGQGFTRIADGVGAVVAADFDNDGHVDLFSWSQVKLYRNNGNETFSPVELPELPPTVSRGACWGDFNGDGLVDLYVGGYENWNEGITYPDMLLLNQGPGGFTLAWEQANRRSRGVTACDFNHDGHLDVYVSNYRLQPNVLWLNDGTGSFRDVAAEYGLRAGSPVFGGGHSIGAAWGDFDNSGLFDLFAGNFAHRDSRGDQPQSRFLRNLGPEQSYRFENLGTCGVHYQESYASPAAGDYDNDGHLDLLFTTVYGTASFGRPNHAVLFRNEGSFMFADVTAAAGLAELPPTYQVAWADFNRDGHLDVVIGGRLFVNQGSDHNWLLVRLQGDGSEVNRSAIGAQVRIRLPEGMLTRQVEAGTGEGNQNDLVLHFGLGEHSAPLNLDIMWPNGTEETISAVEVNETVTMRHGGTP